MTRRFTGWHMTGVLVAMFGVIIAVNFTMARLAVSTFGGTVVENSYVASQRFNQWLAEARDQKAEGWSARLSVDAGRRLVVELRRPAGAVAGAAVTAEIVHPVGRTPDRVVTLSPAADGRYVSAEPLGSGRWNVRITVRSDGHDAFFQDQVRA